MLDTALLLDGYDSSKLTVGCFGGRSALDLASGASRQGFPTLVVTPEGREDLYGRHFKKRKRGKSEIGCVDNMLVVEEFSDVLKEGIRKDLRSRNTIFINSKYFWRRFPDFGDVETKFNIPIFGSRALLRLEGRNQPYTHRDLLAEAGIRSPQRFSSPDAIDRLVIVKVREDLRGYERAFFLAWDKASYEEEAQRRMRIGQISATELKQAVIEEYVVGAPVNFHFFSSPLRQELELVGIDSRRHTNLEGFQRLTATQQKLALDHVPLRMMEIGHVASTLRESFIEQAFSIAEDFLGVCQALPREIDSTGKGIIGPFTLQGAVISENNREEIVVFGVCFRFTSCPGITATPYSTYLHGRPISMGERIAMEIREAVTEGRLHEIVT